MVTNPTKKSSAALIATLVLSFMARSEILRRGPDDDLVDFHLSRLLDGVSDGARDRLCWNRHLVELVQILSGRFLRAAFREFSGNRARRDHGAADILGM